MRHWLAGWLWVAGVASAGEPVSVPLPGEIHAIVADGETLFAVGPDGGLVMDLASGERRPVDARASRAALVDLDGQPGPELVTCGAGGLAVWTWPQRGPVASHPKPCDELAVGRDGQGALLLAAEDKLRVFRFQEGALNPVSEWARPKGELLLAAGGDRFAFGLRGAAELTEQSGWGASTVATGGALGGIGYRDGLWVWSLVDDDVVSGQLHQDYLTARGPTGLWVTDLNGDGVDDLVIRHADRVGVLFDTTETLFPWRGAIDAVGVDRRSCGSVWVASGEALLEFRDHCAAAAPVVAAEPEVATPVAPVAPAATPEVVVLDGRVVPELRFTVGVAGRHRLQDAESRPFRYAARGGPEGMVVLPDGTLEYTPRSGQEGTYVVSVKMTSGVTTRGATLRVVVSAGAPAAPVESTGSNPATGATGTAHAIDYRYRPRRGGSVDTCYAAGGVATALSAVPRNSWEFAGRGPVIGSVSPALALTCEGPEKARWMVGLSTAPTLFFVTSFGDPGQHILVGSLGYSFGGEVFRAGPYAAAGIVMTGLGARAVWLPVKLRGGARTGLDLDLIAYLPAPAGAARLSWTVKI